jgi:hypothetical protein
MNSGDRKHGHMIPDVVADMMPALDHAPSAVLLGALAQESTSKVK